MSKARDNLLFDERATVRSDEKREGECGFI